MFELLIAIEFLVALVLAVWVGCDASDRDMNAMFWALLTFIFGLFGVVLYLLCRDDKFGRRKVEDREDVEMVNFT